MTLKKEAGATLRVTIHRARASGALARDAPGSFYDASCVKTRGEKDRRTHGTKTNEAGGLNRAFRARAALDRRLRRGGGGDRRALRPSRREARRGGGGRGRRLRRAPGVRDRPRHARALAARAWDEPSPWRRPRRREGRERRRPETGTAGTAVSSRGSPSLVAERAFEGRQIARRIRRRDTRDRAARSREARGHRHVVTAPRAGRPKRAPYVRRRGVRVAPAGGARRFARARRRGTERARRERNGENGGARLATRAFENPVSFVSPEATPAPPSTVARACAAARAARDAGLRRAAARGRDASARVFAPQPDGDASDADAARLLVSSSGASALLDVSAGERVPGPGPASARRFAVAPPSLADALAAGGARAGGRRRARARRERLAGYWPRRNRRNRAEIAVAANGERKSGATRRQTPRFVSSATGAAPMEGWTTPAASSRGTRQTRNARTSRFAKTRQTKLGEFASTPEGTPLSQVFKATKTFGGGTRGSGAANPEARQTISVSAFVTPVDVARERNEPRRRSHPVREPR